ncbi:MAG: hypothetical protein ACOC05_00705, partial [Oceanicaulis sp.]
MDMTTRSFVLAAALAFFLAAGAMGWSVFGSGLGGLASASRDGEVSGGSVTITHGSMRDEFGEDDGPGLRGGPEFDDDFDSSDRFDAQA